MASSRDYGLCLVCGDIAVGINFGAATCMPCKAFFRRNAVKLGSHEFVCRSSGNCTITNEYRRSCNCCRLAKCFRVGMERSLILSDEEREARNKLVEMNRLKRGKISKRPCMLWMKPTALLRTISNIHHSLSENDQAILGNLFHAYENTCVKGKNTRVQDFPIVQHTSMHEFFSEVSNLFQIAIEYYKYIPEFMNLMGDDKVRLVKNHVCTIMNINRSLLYPVTPTNLIVTWTNLFGFDITEHLIKYGQIAEQYTNDPIILKLVLIILLLSSSNNRNIDLVDIELICDDTLAIYTAQNAYVELLWKYIISRTAHERDAVKYFNKLMMFILYIQNLDSHIDGYISDLKDEIQQMEPVMQTMWPTQSQTEAIDYVDVTSDMAVAF